jgi:hypothetical protein
MDMIDQTEEIPLHKRKKGKKRFLIQSRLTPEGLERKIGEYRERLQKQMKWSSWGKYEKLRDAETALSDINKKKNTSPSWYNPYKNKEYRIIEGA